MEKHYRCRVAALQGGIAMFEITSLQNPKFKAAVALKERKERDQEGLFLIEGYRELRRAVDHDVKITALLICPKLFLGENEGFLIEECARAEATIYSCAPHLLEKLSYRDRSDGLIAIAKKSTRTIHDLEVSPNSLFIIAEAIEKPGNLGTILRSADAAGADGVIICDRCTDMYNPNVVRASVGTLFTLPVVEASTEETLLFLQKHGIQIVATTPAADQFFTDADLKGSIAIVVGTEQLGLSQEWLDRADLQVKIPMLGVADSLNVASATTLLLYEAVRQRSSLCSLK